MSYQAVMKSDHVEQRIGEKLAARIAWWPLMFLLICFACLTGSEVAIAQGAVTVANQAASLREKYAGLHNELYHNQFHRPLYLDSSENSSDLRGEIYAEVDYPFTTVNGALKGAPQWCDILSLHLNIKYCQVQSSKQRNALSVYIGGKYEQSLEQASHVEFMFSTDTNSPDYLQVHLNADTGPFNTRNYMISLEAIPVENGRTFIRLSYSYESSFAATLALQCYLNTFGINKVGFTIIGKRPDGSPIYAGDVRGVMERNTMRYYLAIDAYLSALSAPPDQRLETRLQNWFTATEHYPLQLHEIAQKEYLTMKHKEYQRQTAGP
jgi:hypothetical protein